MEKYVKPLGKGRGYNLLQAFPAWQLAQQGRKGPVAGVKGWTDSGLGSLLIPAPSRVLRTTCRPRKGGRGRVPATSRAPGRFPHLPLGSAPGRALSFNRAGEGTIPNVPGSSSSAAGSFSHTCSLYPESQVPATGAGSGLASLTVLVRGSQALPAAPTATTMRRKASGSGSSACRTRWWCAGGNALFPQSQAASEPGARGSSHLLAPESGSGSVLHNKAIPELPCWSNRTSTPAPFLPHRQQEALTFPTHSLPGLS